MPFARATPAPVSPRGAPSPAAQAATRVPGVGTPPSTGGFGAAFGRAAGALGFALPFLTEAFTQEDPSAGSVTREGLRGLFDPFGSFSTHQGFPGSLFFDPPSTQPEPQAQVPQVQAQGVQAQGQPQIVDNRTFNLNFNNPVNNPEQMAALLQDVLEQGLIPPAGTG